jgi:hypothetical protein
MWIVAGIIAVVLIVFVLAACRVAGDADDRNGYPRG